MEVSLSLASDQSVAYKGVYVDDVVGPDGASTSFETDSDPLDSWIVSGPPPGSPGNAGDWRTASEAAGPSTGDNAEAALARQPEIIDFLEDILGRYPFREAGGIVDDDPGIGFALENQTRPIYAQDWFSQSGDNTSVIVHELAHQWVGDDLALEAWQHIWLNEGFASYMVWLWSEDGGGVNSWTSSSPPGCSHRRSPPASATWRLCGRHPRLGWRNRWPVQACAGSPACPIPGDAFRGPGSTPARSARSQRARPPHCRPTGPASLPAG